MEKDILKSLLDNKKSLSEMAIVLNSSKSNVNYYISKYKFREIFDSYKNYKKGKIIKSRDDKNSIILAISKSKSVREILLNLNRNDSSSSYKWLNRRLKAYNIILPIFKKLNISKLNTSDIFIKNSKVSRSLVKKTLINKNLIPYECNICINKGEWNNKKLVLILDHIDGINNNNILTNLRFVCPNCNSQLLTHCKGSKGLLAKLDTAPEYESGDLSVRL